jgi:hypothetical protein
MDMHAAVGPGAPHLEKMLPLSWAWAIIDAVAQVSSP